MKLRSWTETCGKHSSACVCSWCCEIKRFSYNEDKSCPHQHHHPWDSYLFFECNKCWERLNIPHVKSPITVQSNLHGRGCWDLHFKTTWHSLIGVHPTNNIIAQAHWLSLPCLLAALPGFLWLSFSHLAVLWCTMSISTAATWKSDCRITKSSFSKTKRA